LPWVFQLCKMVKKNNTLVERSAFCRPAFHRHPSLANQWLAMDSAFA